MKEDIKYCQSKGVTVLLSIGGLYNEETSNYKVTTEENGRDFADFLYSAFGPQDPYWNGPRPFDASPEDPTVIQGFDFDLEARFGMLKMLLVCEKKLTNTIGRQWALHCHDREVQGA